jgi:hypothetical protein
MNEKAIRKLESLSDQIERYRKIATECGLENKAHYSEHVQGIGSGLLLAEKNYLLSLKEEVDRSIAELKTDSDTYMIDDLTYEGVDEVESA